MTLSVADSIPVPVLTDIDKVERILDNIVENSLQYTPAGGRIDIAVKSDERYLYYSICDTGMGFSAKDMEKAFEKFYRGMRRGKPKADTPDLACILLSSWQSCWEGM